MTLFSPSAPDTGDTVLPPWNERDLARLLALDTVAPGHYRTRFGDPNLNGRSYGGQTLGQALMAAGMGVGRDRLPTMMQFLFLQGAQPDRAIDLHVTVLQDGRRFSSRHVRGVQAGGRLVLDAQVSFAVPQPAPAHAAPSAAGPAMPQDLPGLADMPPEWEADLRRLSGYSLHTKQCLEFRVPDVQRQVSPATAGPQLSFWLKARDVLPDDPFVHAAAFAYLSDWWLNFSSVAPHVRGLEAQQQRLYMSSLNHCIWFHRPVRADEWMHFDCHSPSAAHGRGLAIARVHDARGMMVASTTQESLMVSAEEGAGG